MSPSGLLLLTQALSVAAQMAGWAPPVKVTVYYEALCKDAAKFITQQLYPAWTQLQDIMAVELHAHGKSSYIADSLGCRFECQNGRQECEGNMMFTCAKKYIPDLRRYMNFLNCVMSRLGEPGVGSQCALSVGVNFGWLEYCMRSPEGMDLQYKVALKQNQLRPTLHYVPWILINNRFTEYQLRAAQKDLKRLICDTYQGALPSACYKGTVKSKPSVIRF